MHVIIKKIFVTGVFFLFTSLFAGWTGFCAEPIISPEALKELDFGPDITVTTAKSIPATDELPAYCKMEGYRWPDDGFIVKLPQKWNERLYQTGNGNAGGEIEERSMDRALRKRYVSVGGSGGNREPEKGFQFGYPPDELEAQEKIEDYCHESVHETNVLARKIVRAFYGMDPAYAYYDGYSTGGRQGMMEAQRYPEDFDGILAGSPPVPFTMRTMADNWAATQLLGDGHIPAPKLTILAHKVMEKCDSIDGLEDGFIEYPPDCDFNALTDLPACPDDVDGPDCFTTAQRKAIYAIYDGVRDSDGSLLFKGASFGTETIMANGKSGWAMLVPETPGGMTFSLGLGGDYVRWIGLPPTGGGPEWHWKDYDVETDWGRIRNAWSVNCDTYDPNLRMFKLRGGKLILYHGWSDALCWPHPTVDYYEKVVEVMGGMEETQEFAKLYMIPGMTHFPGGPGVFDVRTLKPKLFSALVAWVEKGVAPGTIIGTREAGEYWGERSRPVCPYPQVTRYRGTGSIDDAENFTCIRLK